MDLLPYDEYAASLNRKRTSAGVLFRDHFQRVLLVKPSYKPGWDLPGGAVAVDEPPWRAACREVLEEVGFDIHLERLLVIDYIPTEGPMPEGLAFVFDGGLVSEQQVEAIELRDPEISTVRLCNIDETPSLMKPRLANRVRAAQQAALHGVLTFCESGQPITAPQRR